MTRLDGGVFNGLPHIGHHVFDHFGAANVVGAATVLRHDKTVGEQSVFEHVHRVVGADVALRRQGHCAGDGWMDQVIDLGHLAHDDVHHITQGCVFKFKTGTTALHCRTNRGR